jgi:hypothetical protein
VDVDREKGLRVGFIPPHAVAIDEPPEEAHARPFRPLPLSFDILPQVQ